MNTLVRKSTAVTSLFIAAGLALASIPSAADAASCFPTRGRYGRSSYFWIESRFGGPCSYSREFSHWNQPRYVIVEAPQTIAPQSIVINVPNKNGSFTPVTLQIAHNGTYIGPEGEVYPTRPTMEQLQQMYGK